MRAAIFVAKEMGEELGRGKNLLGPLQGRATSPAQGSRHSVIGCTRKKSSADLSTAKPAKF
jgi:hypothetical protein